MRTDCRICHGTNLERILALAPTPIGDQYLVEAIRQPLHPIDLYQCQDCGLAQMLYELPAEDLYDDYLYLTSSSVGLVKHFEDYAHRVIALCGLTRGDTVIDIGCNDGTLLKFFKAAGMFPIGIEASQTICDIARERGIPVIHASSFGKEKWMTKAKLITCNNTLANIADLDSFMEAMLEALAPDGTFVFESFYLGDVVRNMVFDFIYHEHLSAFSIRPVKRLMERYGMKVCRIEHLETKGGSLRYYCSRKGEAAPEDDDAALYDAKTYRDFKERIEREKAATLAFLEAAKREGKKIAAFGASISCTTLLYEFGLAPYVDYIVDDNPAKIGRFSPGHHIPVHAPGKLYEARPDYVLALAWRFAEDFRRKHPSFDLIRPLPHFQCNPS